MIDKKISLRSDGMYFQKQRGLNKGVILNPL